MADLVTEKIDTDGRFGYRISTLPHMTLISHSLGSMPYRMKGTYSIRFLKKVPEI
jgi:hypothetical protein